MASIRQRPHKDGFLTWAVLWRDQDTGKRTSRTFDDQREATMLQDFLDANGHSFRLAARSAAEFRSQAPKLADVVTGHIEALTGVESGTRARYARMAAEHILASLGARPVDKITRADIVLWFNNLEVAPKTRKNIQAILSAALATAVDEKHLDTNPAKGIRGPNSSRQRDAVFLTPEKVDIIAETIDPRWKGLFHLLAHSGLRYAEATALRPVDVTTAGEYSTLRISRAWKRTADGEQIGTPKSPRSRRHVMLSVRASALSQEDMAGRGHKDLIYARPGGGHLRNGWFHDHVRGPAMAEPAGQGLLSDRPVPHDLRHPRAAWLLAARVPIQSVSARLGLESITTTVNTYGHLVNDADRLAADALDQAVLQVGHAWASLSTCRSLREGRAGGFRNPACAEFRLRTTPCRPSEGQCAAQGRRRSASSTRSTSDFLSGASGPSWWPTDSGPRPCRSASTVPPAPWRPPWAGALASA